ncbi:precorrin-8X methylmutase [Dethiobacter alkaliphilus]|uniref:precorrin-8X methylmutase n=1 Tax=Dethiobacter alkaliphilus TaxID=427926 RepID=UPI00222765D5|nr:precorrin-8X methylmutase [Dethiobacter alkaliphilus]MCW3491484.1 precorrin-8X methylmutase [Dethiobacter alkaliphilus]
MEYIKDPKAIEQKSMAIIEERLRDFPFDPLQKPVIKRVVHTTGDISFADITKFSEGAVEAAVKAFGAAEPVFCDVEMARSGINRANAAKLGLDITCLIHEPAVAEEAKIAGTTRAAAAMAKKLREHPQGGIFVIGNAPTALFVLLEAVKAGTARPALVVGVPVGFVGALESKEWLTEFNIPWITIAGEKGGSTIAAAIVNALLSLTIAQKES